MINAMRLGRSSLVAARFPFNPKKCGDLHFWRYFLAFGMLALRERGRAVQLPQGNYLGLVSSVQPE